MNIIGEVKGKNVLIVDDLIDTAGTLTNAAAVKERGALDIRAMCSHPYSQTSFSKNRRLTY